MLNLTTLTSYPRVFFGFQMFLPRIFRFCEWFIPTYARFPGIWSRPSFYSQIDLRRYYHCFKYKFQMTDFK